MTRRARLLAALLFSVASVGAASAAPKLSGDTPPGVTVRAGVGGAARPGRWMPVQVRVTTAGTPWRGTVTAQWGAASARTRMDLAPLSTGTASLFLRTLGASPSVRVTLSDSGGRAGDPVDTPLVLLSVDGPARVCVGDVGAPAPCDVRVGDDEIPVDWRAFDLADTVTRANSDTSTQPDAERARALWDAARRWQDSGFVDPVSAPFDRDSRLADRTARGLSIFTGVLLVAVVFVTWRRGAATLAAVLPVAVSMAGVAIVTRSTRDADLQASSFVHQFAGLDQSLVFMRGEIEHPGAAPLELLPDVDQGTVDVTSDEQTTDNAITSDGHPLYEHTAGRGARVRFELTGALNRTWLGVTTNAQDLVIENRSPYSFSECQLRSAAVVAIGDVGPGASARVTPSSPVAEGDAVICKVPADWLRWTAPRNPVVTRGSAYLVVHLQSASIPAQVAHGSR